MRLLLDTHAFLWFISGDTQLSAVARQAIEDASNDRYVSIASAWEISIKVGLGKLMLAEPFEVLIPTHLALNGFAWLPIEFRHLAPIPSLPFHHRDPFDRLLVVQSQVENMALVSRDSAFDAYGVYRVW